MVFLFGARQMWRQSLHEKKYVDDSSLCFMEIITEFGVNYPFNSEIERDGAINQ